MTKRDLFILHLRRLERAAQTVLDNWDETASTDLYPFREGFDKVVPDITDWRQNVQACTLFEKTRKLAGG